MKGVEFRNQEGELDEVVVHGDRQEIEMVHFEMMDDGYLWGSIYLKGGKRVTLHIASKGKIRYQARIESY